jgi:hypothetical protein
VGCTFVVRTTWLEVFLPTTFGSAADSCPILWRAF